MALPLRLRLALLLLVAAVPARAQGLDPVGDLAQEVDAAVRAGDEQGLRALAAEPRADPWLVVQRLADRGNRDAALRFARAVPDRPDTAGLHTYAGARGEGRPDELAAILALASEAGERSTAGDGAAAAERYAEAAAAAEKAGWLQGASTLYGRGGGAARRAVAHGLALDLWERRLAIDRRREDEVALARALRDLGSLRGLVGDYDGATQCYAEALALVRKHGDALQEIPFLQNLALVHAIRGRFREAQTLLERALDAAPAEEPLRAELLLQLAEVRSALGEDEGALRAVEGARAIFSARDDANGVGRCLGGRSAVFANAEQYDRMLASAQETAAYFRTALTPAARKYLAGALTNAGLALTCMGRAAEAIPLLEEAIAVGSAIGDQRLLADSHLNLGFAWLESGNIPRAETEYAAATKLGTETVSPQLLSHARFGLARVRLAQGRLGEAAQEADAAMAEVEVQAAGLPEGQGAAVRSRHARLFRLAVEIAARRNEPAEVFAAIERGRAMALLESLEARDQIRAARIPSALREAENAARAAARRAQLRYDDALARGDRPLAQARRAELDAARSQVEEVVRRIQRDARAGAEVLYPRPIALEDAQRRLGPREALLLYAVLERDALALVVTARDVRIVRIGSAADVGAACDAVAADPLAAAARGAPLVEPLALPSEVERVLVSPDGALFRVPFLLLFPGREIAYVPSATTYARLRDEAPARGEGVLAIGDPEYGKGGLPQLPATREEARAVGSAVLLRGDATVEAFRRTLAERRRWRAVHFACHGIFDPKRPMQSALALTATATDDGRLTALDLCEMSLPADVTVLSACDTGRGRAYGTEGLVGLARATLVAGSPRAIVSLWKVDDAATRALMGKFYERWNAGARAAAALREAQAHVRAQKGWEHPSFWAAWVLWGLPD